MEMPGKRAPAMKSRATLVIWSAGLAAFQLGLLVPLGADAQTIRATQDSDGAIRVVAPGAFETTFTRRKGFGHTWFDLKHDPKKSRDLAPVDDENGFLWIKAAPGESADGSWYANPALELELLEAGPVRARVRLKGWHARYGKTTPDALWKDLAFEQVFTLYPTGSIYVDYSLLTEQPVPLKHFLLIIKSTGAWGPNGKGEGRNEVHSAGEHGPQSPSRSATANHLSSLPLQWSNGPTPCPDIRLVMYQGKYGGSYWHEGYLDRDYRTALNIFSRWPDRAAPKGRDSIPLMMRFADDMNGEQGASPYAEDYRSPDRLAVVQGEVDKTDPGDQDRDGFNEVEGCYVLRSGPTGVGFTIHGSELARMQPVFKIKGWAGEAPSKIVVGGRELEMGKGFNASVATEFLLLQVFESVRADAAVTIAIP